MDGHIQVALTAGIICPCSSPAVAGFFFAEKHFLWVPWHGQHYYLYNLQIMSTGCCSSCRSTKGLLSLRSVFATRPPCFSSGASSHQDGSEKILKFWILRRWMPYRVGCCALSVSTSKAAWAMPIFYRQFTWNFRQTVAQYMPSPCWVSSSPGPLKAA